MTTEGPIWRILDANLNRAREALRVLEEYCRFGLEDGRLTALVKGLRHDLQAAASPLDRLTLLSARDAEGDVGVTISTPTEGNRADAEAVAVAAFKRLQEALRALEEYAKAINLRVAEGMERLRFRSYELEREVSAADPRRRFATAKLYVLITEKICRRPWLEVMEAAIAGGAEVVQLREKELSDRLYLERAEKALEVCRRAGVLFVVNDRVDVAELIGADGVHLGQEDLPAERVRRRVAPRMAVGVSTHTLEQVTAAVRDGASYLGVGPVFPTTTKPHEPTAGLEFARQACRQVDIPCFALGGIGPENIRQVMEAGIHRVAVCAAVAASEDPESAARQLRKALEN